MERIAFALTLRIKSCAAMCVSARGGLSLSRQTDSPLWCHCFAL